jgi:hypothetical protein
MTKVRVNLWRLFLSLAFVLPSAGVFFAAQPAAADGVNISNMGNTYFQAEGISPDGGTLCAVWSQFDAAPKGAYLRVYKTASQSWTPPLSSGAFQLSTDNPAAASSTHCAIDAHGNIHAVWQQCNGTCQIFYRFLPAGADPANGGAWSSPTSIDFNFDGPDIDALYADPNGKVWLVYRNFNGGGGVLLVVRSWTPPASGNPATGWSDRQTIDTGSASSEKARIGVDNQGYVQVAWRQGNDGVGYTYRDKTTGQFQSPIVLSGSAGAGMVGLAVNRTSGDVYIVYPQSLTNVFFVKKTGPTGMSLSGAQLVTSTDRTLRTQIAWSQNGRLLLTYDAGGSIVARTSENNGASWDGQLSLAGAGQDPWIVADGTGAGYITYNNSGDVRFSTIAPNTPPTVSGFQAVPNTMTSVTVKWTVSAPASNRIYYSTDPNLDPNNPATPTIGDPAVTTNPAITLRQLAPGTTYYYIVRSTSASGAKYSTVQSFTTPKIELVGVHDGAGNTESGDGTFAGLVLAPAGATQATWTWTAGNQTGTFNVTAGQVNQFGNATKAPVADSTYTVTVHFNDGANTAISAPLHIDPSLATQPAFSDVDPNSTSIYAVAIYSLRAQGMINGYQPSTCAQKGLQAPCFGPLDQIERAASAALVVRALGWQNEQGLGNFSDQGFTDAESWNDVRVLADRSIAFGFGDGTYRPSTSVFWGQMISLITRAMVDKGFWQFQDPATGCFPGIGTSPLDQRDLATYCHYVPALVSNPDFAGGAAYKTPAQRRFVAWLLWEAVQTTR